MFLTIWCLYMKAIFFSHCFFYVLRNPRLIRQNLRYEQFVCSFYAHLCTQHILSAAHLWVLCSLKVFWWGGVTASTSSKQSWVSCHNLETLSALACWALCVPASVAWNTEQSVLGACLRLSVLNIFLQICELLRWAFTNWGLRFSF